MSSRGSFSLGKALGAAVASLPQAWAGAWLALLLLWGAVAVAPMLLFRFITLPNLGIAVLGGFVVVILLKLMVKGALYRTALFGKGAVTEGRGLGGLQLGKPEWRLLGASLINSLFMLLIIGATVIVYAVAFNMSGLGHGYTDSHAALHAAFMRHRTAADWTFILLIPVALIFFVFIAIRFVLYAAATVAEKRMVTLNALGLSAGNAGKLFLGLLVIILPFVIISHVPFGPMHMHILMQHHAFTKADLGGPAWLMHAAMAALSIGVLLPLEAGFLVSAYSQITRARPE